LKSDVAIIGAGPAGTRAAWVLARQGARVTIFDPSHPREKACGGGITSRALDLVADTLDTSHLHSTRIRSARFLWDDGTGASHQLHHRGAAVNLDEAALVVSSRNEFDGALLSAAVNAGAAHVRARALDLSNKPDGVTITTARARYHADFVVGADGPNSLVRRRLARMFRRDQLSIATGYFADGVTSDEIVLEIMPDPPGYIWSFPRPDHLAIGICAQADAGISAAALRRIVAAWIQQTGIAHAVTLRPYAWPIPSLGARDFDALEPAAERWCLVGDAAGLVDPITREGIFFALASGQWAAEALSSGNATWHYSARVRDEAGAELARAARWKAGFFRPRFTELFNRALSESVAIRGVMADLIAGRQSYATLKWRLLGTLELGLACKSFVALVHRRGTA